MSIHVTTRLDKKLERGRAACRLGLAPSLIEMYEVGQVYIAKVVKQSSYWGL